MTEALNTVYETIDEQNRDKSAATRRQLVGGAAAALGSMGLLGTATAYAQDSSGGTTRTTPRRSPPWPRPPKCSPTIVNTVGPEKVDLDPTTRRNVRAAAREELIHYNVLTSDAVGGKAITKRIWVPDEVFSSQENLLKTLVVGDQIFINAYLLGLTVFARSGGLRARASPRYLA
jgi:hypothetical protein